MLLLTTNNLPLEFTQGDTVTLTLVACDQQGNPVTLSLGTTLQTQILGPNGVGAVTFLNAQHTILNQATNQGQFTLALSNSDTLNISEGANKQIVTEGVDLSGAVTYYRGVNILTVDPNVPTQ